MPRFVRSELSAIRAFGLIVRSMVTRVLEKVNNKHFVLTRFCIPLAIANSRGYFPAFEDAVG
jgi:hypothetical protein